MIMMWVMMMSVFGGFDVLQLSQIDWLIWISFEVFVKVVVVGVNFIDIKICNGKGVFGGVCLMFIVFGNDFSGIVVEVFYVVYFL